MTIIDAGLLLPYAKIGKLRVLGVTTAKETDLAPGVPTIAESGLPGYELVGTGVLLAPARTPEPIITRLNREVVRALSQPNVKNLYFAAGAEIVASSPEQLAAAMRADIVTVGKLIKDGGIKLE
jgi:tripartite-type tricarboxylate transporter receptor subunit TctC